MLKNKFLLVCHLDDLNFIISNYKDISTQLIAEYGLPENTQVKIRPDRNCEKNRLQTYFNGERGGDILIQDAPEDEEAPAPAPIDRGLH